MITFSSLILTGDGESAAFQGEGEVIKENHVLKTVEIWGGMIES